MKKSILLILIFCMLSVSTKIQAAIITVDGNYPSVGDYKTISEAHDAASSGDTIYIYPSKYTYSTSTIYVSKSLTIVGCGFNYSYVNDGIYNTKVNSIRFNIGSKNSVVKGLQVSSITIDADNIIIKYNKINTITVLNNNKGAVITQNRIGSSNTTAVSLNNNNQALIKNNIIDISGSYGIYLGSNNSVNILHNVIKMKNSSSFAIKCYDSRTNIGIVLNNIIYEGAVSCYDLEYYNNITNSNQLSGRNGTGNNSYIDMSTVFADTSNYHLKEDSPARGAGYSGEDLGIYGGSSPYVEHGTATGIPSINFLQVPPIIAPETPTMNVQIKATSGSE